MAPNTSDGSLTRTVLLEHLRSSIPIPMSHEPETEDTQQLVSQSPNISPETPDGREDRPMDSQDSQATLALGGTASNDLAEIISDEEFLVDMSKMTEIKQLKDTLANIGLVVASWMQTLPEHRYTEKMKNELQKFAEDIMTTASVAEQMHIDFPTQSIAKCKRQLDYMMSKVEELREEWVRFKEVVGPFLPESKHSDAEKFVTEILTTPLKIQKRTR